MCLGASVASILAQVISVTKESLTDCCDEEQKPKTSMYFLGLRKHL